MAETNGHILLVEPYWGGSHRQFLEGLQAHLDYSFTLLSLPARKWKMRMQTAAPWLAEQAVSLWQRGTRFDLVVASTFLDLAVFRALLCSQEIRVPLLLYFHENQFAYPGQVEDPTIRQFTNINWTSALVADRLLFNSAYNRETFFQGVRSLLKKAADVDLLPTLEEIRRRSLVLAPGIEFSHIDRAAREGSPVSGPVLLWNHRWEHDKDPETFFRALYDLQGQGADFRLIVLGQRFRAVPEIFAQARERLARHILHWGFVQDADRYASLLCQGDIVVSTARHEFFGVAVLEAVRAGCRPLVPDRLSYPELFPEKYRYQEGELPGRLAELLQKQRASVREKHRNLAAPYDWTCLAPLYHQEFSTLLAP